MGTPYAVSSDLVSAWPAKSLAVATYLDSALAAKTDLALTQSVKTGDYTFAKADLPNLVVADKATAIVFTLPTDATVSTWGAGSTIKFLNIGAGLLTITAAGGVTINANTTFATSKGGMLVWTAANTWTLVPFSGGANAAVGSTTGSPTISSYTSGGVTYDLYVWSANGSVTLSRAGYARILVVGGGAQGTAGLGGQNGGGGYIIAGGYTLAAATLTVTIGAGGSGDGVNGGTSYLGTMNANGGYSIGTTGGEWTDDITNTSTIYSRGGAAGRTTAGSGGTPTVAGRPGTVILLIAR